MFSFTRTRGWMFAASLALVLNAGAIIASAQFDPSAQFSPVLNPNGVWTYGFESLPLGSPFNILPASIPVASSPGPAINSWQVPALGLVGVFDNPTPVPQTVTTPGPEVSLFQPGELAMNTGPNDQFGIVQFSAPAAGDYSIQGIFEGIDTAGTVSPVYLLWNNAPVATSTVVGFGPSSDAPLSAGPFFLNVGDTLAYAVGGSPFNSMTAILPGAQVAAVPEPASILLMSVAGFALLVFRPRRARFSSFEH